MGSNSDREDDEVVSIGADVETSFGALEVEDEEEDEEEKRVQQGAPIGVAETGGAGGAAYPAESGCGLLRFLMKVFFAVETSCCSWRLVDGGAGRPEASAAAPEVELLNEDVDSAVRPCPRPQRLLRRRQAGRREEVKVPDRFRRLNFVAAAWRASCRPFLLAGVRLYSPVQHLIAEHAVRQQGGQAPELVHLEELHARRPGKSGPLSPARRFKQFKFSPKKKLFNFPGCQVRRREGAASYVAVCDVLSFGVGFFFYFIVRSRRDLTQ